MKNLYLLVLLFTYSSMLISQNTAKFNCDKTKSEVKYSMSHPMHNWDGISNSISSVIVFNNDSKKIEKVAVSIPISTFDSKNANRDSHMMEVLESLKYPNVTFSSVVIKYADSKQTVTGNLTFHGVTRSITFDVDVNINGNEANVKGNFIVKMADFKIENPSLMGISCDENININFNILYLLK